MQVQILDTTLRDGEQSPGLYFTLRDKLAIARGLSALGVSVIEVGIPAMGDTEIELLQELTGLGLQAQLQAWLRLREYDLAAAVQAGVTSVHFSVPLSPAMIEYKLQSSCSELFRRTAVLAEAARTAGMQVSLGIEDASRTPDDVLLEFSALAEACGAVRLRYADTLGIMTPHSVSRVISLLCGRLTIPLDFHAHNDFGLAVANAHAAWLAGAEILSGTLLGLGERAGNAALEEIIAVLQLLEGVELGFDLAAVGALCREAAAMAQRPIPPAKPLVGELVHCHESGIHVDGLLKNPCCYEAYPPEIFGSARRIVVGKHSGRAALRAAAADLGFTIADTELDRFANQLRVCMRDYPQVDPQSVFETFLRTGSYSTEVTHD